MIATGWPHAGPDQRIVINPDIDRCYHPMMPGARASATSASSTASGASKTVIIWHLLTKHEDYDWVRQALHAKKLRDLELRAGYPEQRGQRGRSYDYNLPHRRRHERARAEQAESAYRRMTEGWRRTGPRRPTGAAIEERQ